MEKQMVTVDLFKLRADHADRQLADAGLVRDLIQNLIDYSARLDAAEKRIAELEAAKNAPNPEPGS